MKRDFDLRGASRREFVQGVVAASAALGLGPTKAIELLDQIGGSALAQTMAKPRRTVNIVAGTGALSWFTLLWPLPRVISGFQSAFAYDDPTKAVKATLGLLEGRSLYTRAVNGNALWSKYGEKKQISAIVCGAANAHEASPSVAGSTNFFPDGVAGATGLFAGSAALQGGLKALVPSIGLKFNGNTDMPYGRAPGAPAVASVVDANAMVGLFSSAASRLVNRLMQPSNQALYSQYYKALLGLTRTADRATFQKAYSDSRTAADLLAKNLGDQLKPKVGQQAAWIANGAPNDKLGPFADSLIVTSNAFKLGLCSQVTIPVFNDDPHGAFANVPGTSKFADAIVNILEAFMADLAAAPDTVYPGKNLSDTLCMTFHGDTPKDGFIASGWPDGTKGGHNVIYVMSQGRIKPGWFGDVSPTGKTNFDPSSGMLNAGIANSDVLDGSLAAILYAVSDADDRRVRDFQTKVNYTGMVNPLISS